MSVETLSALPASPPSEVEWEDLLLKVEILPRVLRNTLEEVDAAQPRAVGILEEALAREARVGAWLARLSHGEQVGAGAQPGGEGRLADRIASLRARNFAMVQRRGLEVWEWRGEFGDEGPVTAFQLLTWLVLQDVRALARLRELRTSGAPAC